MRFRRPPAASRRHRQTEACHAKPSINVIFMFAIAADFDTLKTRQDREVQVLALVQRQINESSQ